MMNIFLKSLFFILLFDCQASTSHGQNLIKNNSCDNGLISGQIPFWIEMLGNGWTQRSTSPNPYNGTSYFFAGANSEAKLSQEINIDQYKCAIDLGIEKFHFVAFVRAFEQTPSDESNIQLDFFDISNMLLKSYLFGPYDQTDIWLKIDSILAVPVNSRKVTIILHSIRHNGSNNDGYYDELSLIPLVTDNAQEIHIDTTICKGQTYLGHSTQGIYTDTLISSNGCKTIRTINLAIKPTASGTSTVEICKMSLPYLWNSINITKAGTYSTTLTNAQGCDSIATLHVSVVDYPKPNLGTDRTICVDDVIDLFPGQFPSYVWQDQSTQSHYLVTQPGLYSVNVTNACGNGSDNILISLKANCEIYFPNIFTPNRDSKNDEFKALNYTNDYFMLRIYNRYGQKLFETTDYRTGWNGMFKGVLQEPGTYIYFCTYLKSNVKAKKKGSFILLY